MKAIIMAGGEGRRLRPLTCSIPKPMMPILDKPVMEYAVELLKDNGIVDIGVTLQYLPDEIIDYFGDGKRFGVNFKYFIEEYPLGTAGSVKNGESFLDDTFIVISGDALTDINISKAIAFHKSKNALGTIVLKQVSVPLEYGVVVTDNQGRVTNFLEKPSWGEVFSDKVNTGIYILEPEIFKYYPKGQKLDFSNDIFPIIISSGEALYGYVGEEYWCDIGNVEQYIRCHFDILNGLVKVKIKGDVYKKGIWIGNNCTIDNDAILEAPVFIGDGVKIYNESHIGPYSILGKNNIISPGVTIKRSVTFDNCYIGNASEVRGGVLCKNVQLESKVSVFEETAIGEDTLVKERAIIKPKVKIWPNKIIEGSTVVNSNIIWSEKYTKSFFGKYGISGEINVDITPEIVSKLGSAYGSILGPDSKVAISCSDDGGAQMLKYSLATGLLSMGVEVYDLKRMTIPMTRHATLFFGVQGSIHVSADEEDKGRVNIIFMDRNGVNIDKSTERKIENSFIREDFRRVKADNFKQMIHLSDCTKYYTRQIINVLQVYKIRNERFKIVLSARNPLIIDIIKDIFSELKINVKIYEEYKDIIGLKKEVLEGKANMGIWINDCCDKAILIDDTGNIIEDDKFQALASLTILKTTNIKTLAGPVTSSVALEKIAALCGGKFIRVKTSQNAVLAAFLKNEKILTRRQIVSIYLTILDPLTITMLILNLIAEEKSSLSSIVALIPSYYNIKKEIKCSWHNMGKIMRNIIEENNPDSIELIQGVKLNFKNSWALIIPDEEEPVCKLFVESKTLEEGERIAEYLADRIKSIIEEES